MCARFRLSECFPDSEGIKTQCHHPCVAVECPNASLIPKGLRRTASTGWPYLLSECFPDSEGIKTRPAPHPAGWAGPNASLIPKGLRLYKEFCTPTRLSPNASLIPKGLRRIFFERPTRRAVSECFPDSEGIKTHRSSPAFSASIVRMLP